MPVGIARFTTTCMDSVKRSTGKKISGQDHFQICTIWQCFNSLMVLYQVEVVKCIRRRCEQNNIFISHCMDLISQI